jgi:hypothetical protein
MNPVTDDDLVLYRYRDGLDDARIGQITAALAASSALRDRYAAIERAIAHLGSDEILPDPSLGVRLWRRLEPQLEEAGVFAPASSAHGASDGSKSSALDRLRSWFSPPLRVAIATVGALFVAIGAGYLVGRQSATVQPPTASAEVDGAATRVLEAYVAANLRETEGVLLTASNSGDASLLEGSRELAQSLVESNRLYALAAMRSGNAQLADFLRKLEPVLLSLANQPEPATIQSSEDLRRFLDATDLLFQIRATEARLDRTGVRRPDDDGEARI